MPCWPAASALVVHSAVAPVTATAAQPAMGAPPSRNATVPVNPDPPDSVAVKFAGCPASVGLAVAASATVPAGTRSYVAPQITQDWSFEYRFARRFTVYGGARNFNGANKRTESAGSASPNWTRPQSYQNFGTLVTLGLRSQF